MHSRSTAVTAPVLDICLILYHYRACKYLQTFLSQLLHVFRQKMILFCKNLQQIAKYINNVPIEGKVLESLATEIQVHSKLFIVNLSVIFLSCLVINCFCLLLDFKLQNVFHTVSLQQLLVCDQMVAVNSKCFCTDTQICRILLPSLLAEAQLAPGTKHFLKVEQLWEQLCTRNSFMLSWNKGFFARLL